MMSVYYRKNMIREKNGSSATSRRHSAMFV
jgi:hypothetical protein